MTAQQIILARLQEGSATAGDLAALVGSKRRTIPPLISRLRNKQFRILSEATTEAHNPRYTLVGGPGSLSSDTFICPACRQTIRLGQVGDHTEGCQFGPKVLDSLLGNPDERRS